MTIFYNAFTFTDMHPAKWQQELHKGDYFEVMDRIGNADPVYGRVLTSPENGYFMARVFNIQNTDGDEVKICIVEPTRKIKESEFETARRRGWIVPNGQPKRSYESAENYENPERDREDCEIIGKRPGKVKRTTCHKKGEAAINKVRGQITDRIHQLTSNPNVIKVAEQVLDAIDSDQTEDFVEAMQFANTVLTDSEKIELERVVNDLRASYRKAGASR